jgi:DNA-binding CsgD family transcriptional regulator
MIAEALEPAAAPIAPPPLSLTRREAEILGLLVAGKPDREIAEALAVSVRTVEHHVARIRQRLGAGTRAELLAKLRGLFAEAEPLD